MSVLLGARTLLGAPDLTTRSKDAWTLGCQRPQGDLSQAVEKIDENPFGSRHAPFGHQLSLPGIERMAHFSSFGAFTNEISCESRLSAPIA